MPKRMFNGHEIDFLMGRDEDNPYEGVIYEKELGMGDGGYQEKKVVVKHPDGKLYSFVFLYDSEHGIYPTSEHPEDLVEAVEVKAVETKTYKYVPV